MSEVLTAKDIRRFAAAVQEGATKKPQFTITCSPKDLWRVKLLFHGRWAAIKAAWQCRHLMTNTEVMCVWQGVLRGW